MNAISTPRIPSGGELSNVTPTGPPSLTTSPAGPPLVVYGAMRRWSPEQFRATLQGYFLPASLIGMGGYWLAGLWVPAVTWYYLLSLPLAGAAIFLGRAVNQRLDGRRCLRCVYGVLAVVGVVLLIQALPS
jgi:uncharacterized membrane protein YfcA